MFGKIDFFLLFCPLRAPRKRAAGKTARRNQFCQTNVLAEFFKKLVPRMPESLRILRPKCLFWLRRESNLSGSVCVATSECGIESLISSVSESNKKNRPLAIPQLHAELTIKENGPAPLSKSCNDFLYQSLTRHFGGGPEKWSFCKISSQHCPAKSIVISRLIRDAPEPKLT